MIAVKLKDEKDQDILYAISAYEEARDGGKPLEYKKWRKPWEYFGYWEVIAWQPLPEPYKEV